jgi:hypothetical protein
VPRGEMGQNPARQHAACPLVAGRAAATVTPEKGHLGKLRMVEAELDRRLEESYQRFSRSEITAHEMARERDRLIRAFNRRVMAENIRYRSMLRRRRPAERRHAASVSAFPHHPRPPPSHNRYPWQRAG